MPDRIIYIYIWKTIERIAFSPKSEKDIKAWFKQYQKFVLQLWQRSPEFHKSNIYTFEISDKTKILFRVPFDLPKFSIDFTLNETQQSFHYDNQYISELDLEQIFHYGLDKAFLKRLKANEINRNEIEIVLNSMIVHPANHVHFEQVSHNARIGFSTKNPFLFLYHLAFQFCDIENDFRNSELKQNEFNRLVEIIERNIKADTISSGVLFGK